MEWQMIISNVCLSSEIFLIYLEFSFSSLWQTFFKFVLASGPQLDG